MRSTKSVRLQTDNFAFMSEVWNSVVANSIACNKIGNNITLDKQLFPTTARCRLTQHMANYPAKFGIKFRLAVNVESNYILNAIPYLGKDKLRLPSQRLSDRVV